MLIKSVRTTAQAIGILLLLQLLAPALVGQKESTEYLVRADLSGTRGGNLVASISTDPATFNRMFATGRANAMVAEQLSADLVHINRTTFEVEPALASRWEVGPDHRTYTIHLRHGLSFSDGTPFTADDVVFTLNVLQDPRWDSIMADQLRVDGKFPAVARIDAYTVRLTWPRQVGTGLRALDSIPMLPRQRLLNAYNAGAFDSAYGPTAPPQEVVGMGPFRLKEYQRGVRVVLDRNPYYWKKDKAGQALPYLDTLTFLVIEDRNAEALRFQAGELDLLNIISSESYSSLRGSNRTNEMTLKDLGPGLSMDFLWFNLNSGKSQAGKPFLDPGKRAIFENASFRQAVSCALDRAAMVRSVYGGLGTPQYGPISSGNKTWYNSGLSPISFNQSRAKALFAQVGLKDTNGDNLLEYGAGGRPFEINLVTTRGNAARESIAEIIRDYLSQVGIRMSVQLVLPNELHARFAQSFDYEAMLFGFTPSDVVPDLQADLWYSSGGSHFWHPNQTNPGTPWEAEIDSLTTRLVQSLDPDVRRKAFSQVQEIWAAQMPAIATVAPNQLTAWRNTLGNIRPSVLPPFLLWNSEELTKRGR